MTRRHSLVAALLVLAWVAAPAGAQVQTATAADGFASRWVASRALSQTALLDLATDPDPVNRQFAMLQLADSGTPSAGAIDALVRGLSDQIERVRLQAAAGLMRLGPGVTAALVRALEDERSIGPVSYRSEAYNGTLERTLRASDMAFTALLHNQSVDPEIVLRAYAAGPGAAAALQRSLGRQLGVPATTGDRGSAFGDRLLSVLEHAPIVMTPALVDALQSPDPQLASIAAARIAAFGEEAAAAIPALAAAATGHPDERVREASARALARMGPPATDALQRLLTSPAAPARLAALAVLPIGAASASASIAAGVHDTDDAVRKTALRRIGRPTGDGFGGPCGRFEPRDREDDEVRAARRLIESLPRSMAADLAGLLSHADAEIREVAIEAFTTFGCVRRESPDATAGSVALALADPVRAVREKAVDELARLSVHDIRGPSSMLPLVLAAMRRESGDRKGELLEIIAGIDLADVDRRRVVDELVTTCAPLRGSTCEGVAKQLLKTPASADMAVAALSERLRGGSPNDDDLYSMLEHLESDRPIFRQALERLLADRRDGFQLRAALGLANHGWVSAPVINVLAAAAAKFDGYAGLESDAGDALVEVGDDGVARLLAHLDDRRTPLATKSALISYVLRGAAKHTRIAAWLLAAAERSGDPEIQARALGTLSEIPDRQEDIRRVLSAAMDSSHADARLQALEAWLDTTLPADGAILRTLRDPEASVRRRAMLLIPRIPSAALRLDAARFALTDSAPEVRRAAFEAVAGLGSDGADLLAAYLDDHDVTAAFVGAIRALRPLGPRLVAALERKARTADVRLRTDIDARLAREGRQAPIDRTRLRERLDADDPSDRASAARTLLDANDDLWTADGRLVAVLMDARVMEIMLSRFGQAMDTLYPPDMTLASGPGYQLPTFPWPPPAGYAGVAVPRSLLALGPQATVGDVYGTVVKALTTASTGFTQGLFSAPGGFALVARMERIAADGTPLPGRARWIKEGSPTLSLAEFLGDLFFERPGYFRVVAFVVTNSPNVGSDAGARLPLPEEGALAIPPELAKIPLADQELLALVYSFERRRNAQIQPWQDGAPSPREHLERAGIWPALMVR